ncbi:MAG: hypothetical protein SchgKO_20330 [Schleiferiaceae bacterium]
MDLKKITLSLLAGALGAQMSGQIFSEDFATNIPSTFTLIDNDGFTPASSVSFVNDAWVHSSAGGATAGYAVSNSWYSPAGQADDWMITPGITIPSGNDIYLVWDATAVDASYPDGYNVKLSTTGTNISDFSTTLLSVPAENVGWTARYADLSNYSGQTIYIAFQNNSTDMFLLYVDNIVVDTYTGNDVSATAHNVNAVIKTGQSTNVSALFENIGKPVASMDVYYQVDAGTPVMESASPAMAPGGSYVHSFTTAWAPPADGNYTMKIWAANINGSMDDDTSNDTLTVNIKAMANPPARRVVVEEKTGTWCGWCPRGTVGMDYMHANYGSQTSLIAVHNGDPMVVSEYDSNIGSVAPGGYPGSAVDRVLGPDPGASSLEQAFNIRKDVAPSTSIDITGATYDKASGALTVNADAQFFVSQTGVDYRFVMVLTENNVMGTTSGYAQANYYAGGGQGNMGGYESKPDPVPASDMSYHFVARTIQPSFGGTQGSIPATIAENQVVSETFTYTIPSDYNPVEMKAIVMVVDGNTNAVLNSDSEWLSNLASVSVKELISEGKVSVFPNPSSDIINIEFELLEDADVTVEVINMMGQTVFAEDLGNLATGVNRNQISVSTLTPGVYFANITIGDEVITTRINVVK